MSIIRIQRKIQATSGSDEQKIRIRVNNASDEVAVARVQSSDPAVCEPEFQYVHIAPNDGAFLEFTLKGEKEGIQLTTHAFWTPFMKELPWYSNVVEEKAQPLKAEKYDKLHAKAIKNEVEIKEATSKVLFVDAADIEQALAKLAVSQQEDDDEESEASEASEESEASEASDGQSKYDTPFVAWGNKKKAKVVIRHSDDRTLRVDPETDKLSAEGKHIGQKAHWKVEINDKKKTVQIKNKVTGKYLQINKKGTNINCKGAKDEKKTKFKFAALDSSHIVRLESKAMKGNWIGIDADGIHVTQDPTDEACEISFYKK